jgi:beta-glucanase (GH16 family)
VTLSRTATVLGFSAFLAFSTDFPAFAQEGWQLVWSDEFTGPANSAPDLTKWTYDLGATGWGNRELENYTGSRQNALLDGRGNLVIRALKTAEGGYTSARLKTQGKFTFTYGKVEARIKIPFGQGIWPAFWMLGANIGSAHWPACGEVDIMENIGKEPARVHGTVHGPGYSGGNGIGRPYDLAGGGKLADDFHLFTVVWQPESVEFLVDGVSYHKVTHASLPQGARWVFDAPMFLLLNLAIGGNWPGNPDSTTQFPQEMVVDYVRMYRGGGARP